VHEEWCLGRSVIKKLYYGWLDKRTGEFRVSLYPPDAPVRPSIAVATKKEAVDFATRKRAQIYWSPELPLGV
jgi:hypothetical protein